MDPAAWKERAGALEGEVYALYVAFRDPRTPWHAKAFLLVLVGYAASPIDPIPDFIPGIGYLDELLLLPLGVLAARRLVPRAVLEEARREAEGRIEAGRKRWVAAAGVLAAWLGVGYLVFLAVGGLI